MIEGSMHVQPVVAPHSPLTALQRLVDACHSSFDGSHAPPTADTVSFVCSIIDKIEPDDVGLMDEFRFSSEMSGAGCQNPPIITCKIIHDCNTFTITVFFLPPAAAMPLHNHPGMTVFSKLLVGSAHVVSYDWVHPRVCAAAAGSEPGTTTTTMLAEKVLDERFTAASGAWALFPDAGGNLHRFVAGEDEPCAFLDVITPPYSPASEAHAQQRFSYYQEFPYELRRHPSHGTDGGELTEEQKRQLAWLQEIGDEPKDLRISNLPYRGPPIA